MAFNNCISALMEGFYNYLMNQKKKISSIERYINIVRRFHNHIGKTYIDVNQNDIQCYLNFLLEFENLQQTSLNRHLAGIKEFYKYLLTNGYLFKNPCDKVRIK